MIKMYALLDTMAMRVVDSWSGRTGLDKLIGLLGYGDTWRTRRRAFHQHFNERSMGKYDAQMVRYPRMLVKRLLDAPDDFLAHASWCARRTIHDNRLADTAFLGWPVRSFST